MKFDFAQFVATPNFMFQLNVQRALKSCDPAHQFEIICGLR